MSRTLNFIDFLVLKARNLHQSGHTSSADELLVRLARLKDLSPDVAEEVHARLGRIRFDEENYRQARRHFAAASALAPHNAEYHHLAAIAQHDDPRSDATKVASRFRRAMRLDPKNPTYRADYGIFALETGQREEALKLLGQACDLAGADVELVGRVVDALLAFDEAEEARKLLRTAMFRHSNNRRFRDLWNNLQYKILCGRQNDEVPVEPKKDKQAVILPFLRPFTPENVRRRTANVRQDAAGKRKTLHLRILDKQQA